MPAMPWHVHRYWSPPGRAPGATILRGFKRRAAASETTTGHCNWSVQLADALLGCGDQAEGRAMLVQALQIGARAGVYQTSSMPERTWRAPVFPAPRHPQDSRLPRSSDPTSEAFSRAVLSSVHARCRLVPARHGVAESSRAQHPALDELWTFQQMHRSRAADCP